jgi:uncharacterized Zn finger protein
MIHNIWCTNPGCTSFQVVEEFFRLSSNAPLPACTACGQIRSITFTPTERQKAEAENAKGLRSTVRDPFLKPETKLRRAFDPKSTPSDLADDLRTGDIYE